MVCTCSVVYMRAGIGNERLVVCLSEYLPLCIVYRISSVFLEYIGVFCMRAVQERRDHEYIESNRQYGVCGSRNYRRFGRRATDVKTANAGPKLHWRLWEKSAFPALTLDPYFSANNNEHDGNIWVQTKLFLAYCL